VLVAVLVPSKKAFLQMRDGTTLGTAGRMEFVISITECGALRKAHNHLCAVVSSAVMVKNNGGRWKVKVEGETKPLYSET
jgi:ketosteroid isomerase-like protein